VRPYPDRSAGGGPDLPRLFVAVPVPADTGAAVGGVIDDARHALGDGARRIRWVQLQGLHITLRFLGPTPVGRVGEVSAALDRAVAGIGPFDVRFAGSGSFPTADRPRALWLGIVEGADALGQIAAAFEEALSAAGWPVERRPFRPHMTVARTDGAREGPGAASSLARAAASLDAGFRADRVVLYRSHLGSGPAKYEALHEAILG
jgi:2'-5' RNA ligase